MTTPAPWQCPECGAWIAPHVTEHRCDPPEGGVRVTLSQPPGSGGTFTYSTTPCTVTVNVAGSVTTERDLVAAVQDGIRKVGARNWQTGTGTRGC